MGRILRRFGGATMVMVVCFVVTLVLACTVPSDSLWKNAGGTVAVLREEGLYPAVGISWRRVVLDNFTDSVMLNIAYSVDSNSPAKSALANIQHDGRRDPADQEGNLAKLYEGGNLRRTVYERYWHGYLVVLRPMLAFFSYPEFRVIWSVVLYGVSMWFLVELWHRAGPRYAIALFAGLVAVDFFFISKSLQLSNVFMTGMLSALYLMRSKRRLDLPVVFFVVGGLTSFFDVLSAPLVSLGLVLFTVFGMQKNLSLKKIATFCLMWLIGYSVLWGSKWVIAELTYSPGAIRGGIAKVGNRTSGEVEEGGVRWLALERNVYQLRGYDKRNKFVDLGFGIVLATFVALHFTLRSMKVHRIAGFLAIGVIPYLWYMFAAEHSYIHVLFTYRNQFLTVVAGMLLAMEFVDWKLFEKRFGFLKSNKVSS